MKNIFARKSIHSLTQEAEKKGLERTLTGLNLTTFGIGAIIGAGIFVMTGQAAAHNAGPGVILSFIFAALLCVFVALCYAEFAALIPIAGGPYSYTYATLGEIAAWTVGWGLTLEFLFSAATVAVSWSGYFSSLLSDLGVSLPAMISQPPLLYNSVTGWEATGALINLPAVIIVSIIGIAIAFGINIATSFNNILVVVKFLVIFLFLACGFAFVKSGNWVPFIPENTGVWGEFGFSGVIRGAGIVFFAYLGFDAVATLAQESRRPQRDLPIGMIGSLAISTVAYILIALVLTGVVSFKSLGGEAPFADAINAFGPKFFWLRVVAKCGILAGFTSVILVMLLGQSRIFFTIAQDGLLPKIFGKAHPKYHTPFFNTLFFTGLAALLCAFFPTSVLGEVTSMGALLAFAFVCVAVIFLRFQHPKLARPFKCPLFPWIPIAGTLSCLVLMFSLQWIIWMQLIAWTLIGYVVYFLYGIRHSHLKK